MRKFCKQGYINTIDHSDFYNFLGKKETEFSLSNTFLLSRFTSTIDHMDNSCIFSKTKGKRAPLPEEDYTAIEACCKLLYPKKKLKLLNFVTYYKQLSFAGEILSTNNYHKGKNTHKYVPLRKYYFDGSLALKIERPAVIKNIVLAEIEIGTSKQNIYFVDCLWFKEHPYIHEYGNSCFMKIWGSLFEDLHSSRFIQRKFVRILTTHQFPPAPYHNRRFLQADKVNFVIPLKSKSL